MRRPRPWLAAASLVLIATFFSACNLGEGCACGADPSRPLSEHDLSFNGSHSVDDECVCQCGTDTPYGLVQDRECGQYEEACIDGQGTMRALVCE